MTSPSASTSRISPVCESFDQVPEMLDPPDDTHASPEPISSVLGTPPSLDRHPQHDDVVRRELRARGVQVGDTGL